MSSIIRVIVKAWLPSDISVEKDEKLKILNS